jgi:putative flavoprotein involved in K+ transport
MTPSRLVHPGVDADVVIVGAGPAGLALARALARAGREPVLLERAAVGATWTQQPPWLRLHTRTSAASLPGVPWRGTAGAFPTAAEFAAYLRSYALTWRLDVREGVDVRSATRGAEGWTLTTSDGWWRTDTLVMATGIFSAPVTPALPGLDTYRGRLRHAAALRAEAPSGGRVLVVGVGNTGKDVALASLAAGAAVSVAVRSGVRFAPYPTPLSQRSAALWGRLPPRLADALMRRLRPEPRAHGFPWPAGRLTDAFPVVGMELLDAAAAGRIAVRPAVVALTERGARFADGAEEPFDEIVLATGYRPALDPVADHVRLDAAGRPRIDGFAASGAPGLFLVGYTYPTLETWLQRLRRDVPAAARAIAQARNSSSASAVSLGRSSAR